MGRIRTVKPELLTHEVLFELEEKTGLPMRIAFVGLFTICDREGRFKWEPRRIKLAVLPYDSCDFSRVLDALMTREMVRKYIVDGVEYGLIPTFLKHQVINNRESESEIPPPEKGVIATDPESAYAKQSDGSFMSITKGYVYMALCRASAAFKIGFSENDPEQRVRDLSTGSPNDLEMVEFIEADKSTETAIHRALSEHRRHGEWFNITDGSISAIDAWFTRGSRVLHAASGEGKGKEGKGREGNRKGKEGEKSTAPSTDDAILFPEVSAMVVSDFKAHRKAKKAPITLTAMLGIASEAKKAGVSLEAAMSLCCTRGWTGFKAEWVADRSTASAKQGQPSRHTGFDNLNYNEGIENGRF